MTGCHYFVRESENMRNTTLAGRAFSSLLHMLKQPLQWRQYVAMVLLVLVTFSVAATFPRENAYADRNEGFATVGVVVGLPVWAIQKIGGKMGMNGTASVFVAGMAIGFLIGGAAGIGP